MHPRSLKLVGVILSALVAAACGNGPELVDQTQPNYVKKSELLDGTWYIQDTVVGVPSTSAITFEGFQSSMDKVRFEVQEDYLVAYRTYEYFPGSEASVDRAKSTIGNVVNVDGTPYRGAPIAAWKIESHFDRIRQYNPATGEQSNVLVENTTDRPWYERDYMRVNWGKNVITNWSNLSPGSLTWPSMPVGGFNTYVQPIDQNPGDDALTTDYQEIDGKRQLAYLDFTVRQYWEPESYDYPGYGRIPMCWLNPTVDCGGAVIKVRTSVMKVDPKRVADYEPLRYDDTLMKKFGFFRMGYSMERPTYDRDRGATLSGRLMYAERHNIWAKAHDANGAVIPVQQRELRPIVYFLSDTWPQDMMESARQLEQGWDHAFRKAVAVPRGVAVEDVPQMFVLCQNPVPAGAPAACGPEGTHVRMGDIRHNMLNWVQNPQMAGPLGYGPVGVDPETGEIIHAVANLYGAGIDSYAGSTLQLLDVMNGDISLQQLVTGKDVRDYLATNRNPTDPRRASGPAQSSQGLTSDSTQKLGSFSAISGDLKTRMDAYRTSGSLPLLKENRRAVVDQLIAQNPQLEATMVDLPEIRGAVLSSAPGETWRQRLMNDSALYRKVARETLLRYDELEKFNQARQDFASRNSIWLAEFSDDSYIQMAQDMKSFYEQKLTEYRAAGKGDTEAKTLAKTDAWTRIRNALNRMVAEHETGHTLGLTHNFEGTFDALNFKDGYWDLRKSNIGVLAGGQRVLPFSPQDLKDASKLTEEQLAQGIVGLQYSTVMDYPARFPLHGHGLGKYDEAAILFGYAGGSEPGWVEVFNVTRADTDASAYTNPNMLVPTTNTSKPMTVRGAHVEIPMAQVDHWNPVSNFYTDRFHYTTLPFAFADRNLTFEQSLDQGIARMQNRSYRPWSEMKPVYDDIAAKADEYNQNAGSFQYNDLERAQQIVTPVAAHKPVEVPYMYCSDYEVGANLACNRWDQGADYYEMSRDWMERYTDYYVFSNFRRDRALFNPINVMNSKYSRFIANLPNVYQHWLFSLYWYQFQYSLTTEQMEMYLGSGDPITQNYWTMATIDGVNLILGQLATPSAGYFGKDATSGRWVHVTENVADNSRFNSADELALRAALTTARAGEPAARYTDVVYVPRGPGKSQYTLYDTDGYDFYNRANEVGHFWDQYAALLALSQSESSFIGVDKGADAIKYSLPYYMIFPKELSNLVSGVWLQDNGRYASELVKLGDGTEPVSLADVRPVAPVRAEKYIAGFVYPPVAEGVPVDPVPAPEQIEASPTWSTRFYAELYGMAFFTQSFNQDFANQNQVFRLGSGESVSPISGFEVVSFDDPFGGAYSYAALRRIGDPQPPAAVWQILKAQELKSNWDYKKSQAVNPALTEQERQYWAQLAAEYEGKTRDAVRNLEMMRGLYSIFGRTW